LEGLCSMNVFIIEDYTICMSSFKTYWREAVLTLLILANASVWGLYIEHKPSKILRVYFLDVGQGDAIFIDSPTHGRILLDGGPNGRVLSELGKILPFGDRRIDVMIESHPDADHISGLVDVLRNYKVSTFLEPGVNSTNDIHTLLAEEIKKRNIPDLLARRGIDIDLGDGVKLQILFPNQDVHDWETNDASIVAKLVYGEESFLLTGDSTKKAEYLLLALNPDILNSDVLKAGHHGSATSDSPPYVDAVSPEYAVISAGKGNPYGLPKQVTLDTLRSYKAKILATEDAGGLTGMGTIEFDTDGKTLTYK
jgi:competence protein ComEC